MAKMINLQRIRKVSAVSLKRVSDSAIFCISAPCILLLPDGLVHVTGLPTEELDTDIWDVRERFEVLETKDSTHSKDETPSQV
jgi:hypothetical protein